MRRLARGRSSQSRNLRLTALLSAADELEAGVTEITAEDSLTNPEPERYRAFGLPRTDDRAIWEHGGKMRFQPRWVATVPNIDLAATFHCGSRFVIGSQRETSCLESATGRVLWKVAGPSFGNVATPLGIARLHADGRVELVELETGETRFVTRLKPRATGGAAGALVNAHGLPRLLVVGEGDRSVTALDLVSGEVRWRSRRAARRATACGGPANCCWLPAATRPWSPSTSRPASSSGASAIASRSPARSRFTRTPRSRSPGTYRPVAALPRRSLERLAQVVARSRGAPGRGPRRRSSPPTPSSCRFGIGAALEPSPTIARPARRAGPDEPGLASAVTAWLALDDVIVANSASGVLFCLDADTGIVRYNHVFSRHVEADKPRRLEPVLRNGALFVPQHQVQVVRPRDGELLGAIPSDLIPDLVRVDEHCSVYIAEESGHVAAFGVARSSRWCAEPRQTSRGTSRTASSRGGSDDTMLGSSSGPPTAAAFSRTNRDNATISTRVGQIRSFSSSTDSGTNEKLYAAAPEVRHAARARQHQRHHPAVGAAGERAIRSASPAVAQPAGDAALEPRHDRALVRCHRRQPVRVVVLAERRDPMTPTSDQPLQQRREQRQRQQQQRFEPARHRPETITALQRMSPRPEP